MNVTFDRPGWSYEILKALHVFHQQEEYCDVVVVCNDKKIRAHSCVLAAASPWVASELQCGSSEGPVQIVSLEDTPSQVVQYIMTFVYTGQFKVPLKHIKEAQSLASRLGIRCLKDRDEDDDGSGDEGSHGDHGNHGDSPPRDIPARDTPVRARGAGRRASDHEHRVPDSSLPSDTVVTLNRDWCEADSTPSASQSDSTPTVSQSTSLTLPSSSTPDPGVPAPSLSHLSGTPLPGTSRNSRLKRVAQDHEDIKPDTPPKKEMVFAIIPQDPSLPKSEDELELKEEPGDLLNADPVTEGRVYRCTVPGCVFETSMNVNLKKHHVRVHIDKKYGCEQCESKFAVKSELKRHVANYHTDNHFECSLCRLVFANPNKLDWHLRSAHGDKGKMYKCGLCDKNFSDSRTFQGHINKHGGLKPFKCPQCDKRYANQRSLIDHKHIHNAVKYKCGACHREFGSRRLLSFHQVAHTSETFTCERCGMVFKWKQSLVRHVNMLKRCQPSNGEGDM